MSVLTAMEKLCPNSIGMGIGLNTGIMPFKQFELKAGINKLCRLTAEQQRRVKESHGHKRLTIRRAKHSFKHTGNKLDREYQIGSRATLAAYIMGSK